MGARTRRRPQSWHANSPVLVVAGLALVALTVAAAPDEDAKQVAVKVTTAGAALFDARDAKGLALTYAEDARLEIIIKDKDSGELKTETKVGRAEIEAYYQELFQVRTSRSTPGTPSSSPA